MSSTRVHDRHISLHLQGSLGERTEGKKRLMGYIFVLRSHALICCHRNANACRKRQHCLHTRCPRSIRVPSVATIQDASRSLPFPKTSEWRWFLQTARETGKARKLLKSWSIPLPLETSSRASFCSKQWKLAIECCYIICLLDFTIGKWKKDWFFKWIPWRSF